MANNFRSTEKVILETIKGVKYIQKLDFKLLKQNLILLTNSQTSITKIPTTLLNHTKLIVHANSGHDNFPSPFVKKHNFPIVIGNDIRKMAVTNHILSILFFHYSPLINQKNWSSLRHNPRKLISELNILILGFGKIGSLVYKNLKVLNNNVSVVDPYKNKHKIKSNSFDVIICCCSLNQTTKHAINKNFLTAMLNPDGIFINPARGNLIHKKDFLEFFKKNKQAAAYLDVFPKEPHDFKNFSQLKNIKCTSHIAGVYANLDNDIIKYEKKVILDFLKTQFEQKYKDDILKNILKKEERL